MTSGPAGDEAESVGPLQNLVQSGADADSADKVGDELRSAAVIQPTGTRAAAKRAADQENGPADSTQSIFHVNPEAPGWIKRVRVGGNAAKRTSCLNRVGALEKTIWSYVEKRGDHIVEPLLGLTFDSLGEAYDFYNLYSWEHGFRIRYDKSRLNPKRTKTMQEIVCGCAGKPGKDNSRLCCCECPSMIWLLRTKDNNCYIAEQRVRHNHAMSVTYAKKIFWLSHKHIDAYTKDLVKQLRDVIC
uniref:Uncharacterized protein n=1 Tax=Avena sativa TaxID=4498 RepID=A0ACD6AJR7_AVESA